MKVSEICKLIDEGKTVLIKDNGFAGNQDIDIDKNMIVEYIAYENHDEDSIKLYYTLETFRKHNEKVAVPAYFDNDRNPVLTIFQSKFYTEKDSAYFMPDDDIGEMYTEASSDKEPIKTEIEELKKKLDTILAVQGNIMFTLKQLEEKLSKVTE